MGFTWFRAESDAADHPKVMELATALGVPLVHADGFVFRLWCWTQRYAPLGAFSARAVPQLEQYLGREGVIQIMREVRLVDATSDGFLVHDWPEMQGALVEKSKRDAKIKRLKRRERGAKTARAGRARGAQTALLQDRTGQDTTGQDEKQQKPPPKPSAQQDFFAWTQAHAAQAFPARMPEKQPDPRVVNAQLAVPLAGIGRIGLEAAWGAFERDQYAIDAGLPWALFVSQIPKLHNKATVARAAVPAQPQYTDGPTRI